MKCAHVRRTDEAFQLRFFGGSQIALIFIERARKQIIIAPCEGNRIELWIAISSLSFNRELITENGKLVRGAHSEKAGLAGCRVDSSAHEKYWSFELFALFYVNRAEWGKRTMSRAKCRKGETRGFLIHLWAAESESKVNVNKLHDPCQWRRFIDFAHKAVHALQLFSF